eukprot:CAMPEP_0184326490 /NCGR_PEP_ID=MMETSP1049-20130417/142594_1 /TAXON_ID=77928 /ORGANISM="Proteomonas sulcata, Strain CCMP704" /LENGTH=77 /DNA_ID=CAMNT_0026648693 /DNA_START=515 /DNA_END=748 /DNA_ORIENTATION=-
MLFKILPMQALAASFTRKDGLEMTGDTGSGFSVVDPWHPFDHTFQVDTRYAGGPGLGLSMEGGPFAGDMYPMDGSAN